MAQWGNRDQKSDAPKFVVDSNTGQTGQEQFGNTVFGVDANETAAARGDGKGSVPPGWVRRVEGTGGRSGRVTHEVLVAMSSNAFRDSANAELFVDATDFANTSTTDVANTAGTADDTEFPDS